MAKRRLSSAERRRLRKQARINFGLVKKTKVRTIARRNRSRRRSKSGMSGMMRIGYGLLGYKLVGRNLLDKSTGILSNIGVTGIDPALEKAGVALAVKTFVKNKWVSPIATAAVYIEGDKALQNFNVGGIFNTSTAAPATASTTTSTTSGMTATFK